MPEDARNRFDEDVFAHRVTKGGKVLISWQGRLVTTVAGKPASRLIERLATADRREIQHLLARATGNFKHGNEREGKQRDAWGPVGPARGIAIDPGQPTWAGTVAGRRITCGSITCGRKKRFIAPGNRYRANAHLSSLPVAIWITDVCMRQRLRSGGALEHVPLTGVFFPFPIVGDR